jgi:hypothetical protein
LEADLYGYSSTTPVDVVTEAERIANIRPSRPASPTPITDARRRIDR